MSQDNARTVREEWGTRFGFLMAMVGAMVGSGNIWRMPYTTGQNGGGAFLVAYLILLYVIAVPGLMAETMLGRYTNKGVIGSFKAILGEGWAEGFGLVVLVVNVALMSYYSPIIGWILYYTGHSFLLTFSQPGFDAQGFWTAFSGSPVLTVGMHTVAMILTAGVLFFGIRRGIERVVRWMFPALVVALIAVAVRSLTLPGAMAGLAFAFTPDWTYLVKGETWIAALGQALFSTGLGWGIALTYGSYLRKHDDVPLGGGLFTAVGNTSIGLLAIFAVFPAVFAFGLEPTAGVNLTFVSLVQVFPRMLGGPLWAILFFVGFFFAAFTSALAITEVGVTTVKEETRLSRSGAVLAVTGVVWLLGIPSAYSSSFLGVMDFMFGNWGLPLATLMIITLVGWHFGPDWDSLRGIASPERARVIELSRNADIEVGRWWDYIVKFVIPALMVFIMLYYVATNYATNTIRTVGGLAFIAAIVVGSIVVMHVVREPTRLRIGGMTETRGGDD